MNLIGLHGYARSGKDTYGAHLIAQGYAHYSFASPIRQAASKMFGIPVEQFEGTNPNRDQVDPFWGISLREMLQRIGTEGGRDVFGQDLWVKRAKAEWEQVKQRPTGWSDEAIAGFEIPTKGLVITDVRFENEADWIASEGGYVLKIDRPGVGPQSNHASEAGLADKFIHATIANHGTVEDLYQVGDLILKDLLEPLDF